MIESNKSIKNTIPLVPAHSTELAAQRIAGFLAHPRSLVRIAPSWAAPQTTLEASQEHGTQTTVRAYRRRISATAWRRIIGENPPASSTPEGRAPDLYVVTLHAIVSGDTIAVDSSLRSHTATIHSLFRLVIGTAVHDVERIAEAQGDGSRAWTWHALMTGQQLRQRGSALAESPHGRAA
ncbi:hypothetical protein [Corynebacterium auriscanis]|uniref:hypothetical protein n=1 Tax=Corynebacterium auriscanis TaxID=99807 RepID=UPI0024AD6D82|nr:hypothetical protein [Corynebacterium auriscanis]